MGRTRVVQNPDPARGLASSLQSGLRSLDQSLHAALVLLGDMPGVTTALIDELVARGRETRASAVVSVWRGRRSPPVVLHQSIWAAALALDGDIGMREVLAGRDDVVEVEVTPALGALDDVDTPEDHVRLRVRGDTPTAARRSDGESSAQ
jgi:molybdenum cofactor cytidylyltransferase